MSYKAFLSYSHTADAERAPAIHAALHRFARPWYALRAIHVFRDQTNLAATPELWPAIQNALDASEFFLLLASPEAAASKWVAREIEHWCATKSASRIVIVVSAGAVKWDETRGDFDFEESTALPRALAGRFETEPLWVDLSWAGKPEELSLRHLQFRDRIATVAATLHGKKKETLDGEDVREHKRTWLLVRSVITVLAVLVTLAFWQYTLAEDRRRVALSRQLAAQSVLLLDDSYDRALLLAAQAFRIAPTLESRNALFTALAYAQHGSTYLRQRDSVNRLAFNRDGTRLVAGGADIVVWDMTRGTARETIAPESYDNSCSLATSPAEDVLVRSAPPGVVIRSIDGKGGEQRFASAVRADSVAISASGRVLAFLDANGTIHVRHRDTGAELVPPIAAGLEPHDRIVFSRDTHLIGAAAKNGQVKLWRLADAASPPQVLQMQFMPSAVRHGYPAPHVIDIAFAGEDGTTLVVGTDDGLRQWNIEADLAAGEPKATRLHAPDAPFDESAYAVSADGRMLAAGFTDGAVRVWNVVDGTALPRPLTGHANAVRSLTLTPDGSRLAAGYEDGTVRVWDLTTHSLGQTLQVDGVPVAFVPQTNHIVTLESEAIGVRDGTNGAMLRQFRESESSVVIVDRRGQHLAAGSSDGILRVWRLSSGKVSIFPRRMPKILAIGFSPRGDAIAAGGDGGQLVWWRLAPTPRVASVTIGTAKTTIWSVAFSVDGARVLAGTSDGIAVWNPWTGDKRLSQAGEGVATAFNADGSLLAAYDFEDRLRLWRVDSGLAVEPPLGILGVVNDLAFSPSGELVAASDGSGSVFLWDVASGQRFGPPLFRKKGEAFHFAFRDDSAVLAVQEEQDIVLWDLSPTSWLRRARATANRNLTEEEWQRYIPDDRYEKTFDDLP